jgi:hypothetical protein
MIMGMSSFFPRIAMASRRLQVSGPYPFSSGPTWAGQFSCYFAGFHTKSSSIHQARHANTSDDRGVAMGGRLSLFFFLLLTLFPVYTSMAFPSVRQRGFLCDRPYV